MFTLLMVFSFVVNGKAHTIRWESPRHYEQIRCGEVARQFSLQVMTLTSTRLPKGSKVTVESTCALSKKRIA